jgi:hypothetical protein
MQGALGKQNNAGRNQLWEEVMLNVTVKNIGELAVVECEGRIVQSEAAFKLREAVTSQEDRFGMTTSGILHGSAAFMLHAYFKPMLLSVRIPIGMWRPAGTESRRD